MDHRIAKTIGSDVYHVQNVMSEVERVNWIAFLDIEQAIKNGETDRIRRLMMDDRVKSPEEMLWPSNY